MFLCTSWITVSSLSVIFENSSVCVYAKPFLFLLKKRLAVLRSSFVLTLGQYITIWSVIHSAKRCCYRKSICNGALCIRTFFLCTPLYLYTPFLANNYVIWVLIYETVPKVCSQRDTLCVRSQDILILKGTKHRLSEYDKMQILYRLSKASLTVQFSFWSITERQFEKQDKQGA